MGVGQNMSPCTSRMAWVIMGKTGLPTEQVNEHVIPEAIGVGREGGKKEILSSLVYM